MNYEVEYTNWIQTHRHKMLTRITSKHFHYSRRFSNSRLSAPLDIESEFSKLDRTEFRIQNRYISVYPSIPQSLQLALSSHFDQSDKSSPIISAYNNWFYLPDKDICFHSSTFLPNIPYISFNGKAEILRWLNSATLRYPSYSIECTTIQKDLLDNSTKDYEKILKEKGWNTHQSHPAIHSYYLYKDQQEQIRTKGLEKLYTISRDAQISIAECEFYGMHFDRNAHSALISLWEAQSKNLEARLISELGSINLQSPKQVSKSIESLLYRHNLETLKNTWPRTKSGDLTTDSSHLRIISKDSKLGSIIQDLLDYKGITKLLTSYGENLQKYIDPLTSRMRSYFRINGAVTGRLTSSEPNMQNLPHTTEFRKLFKAGRDRLLIVGDYSQIDLRVAAVLSQDKTMLQCYQNNEDLHSLTASKLLKISIDTVTPDQRRLAKAVNFGLLYGQGPSGLSTYALSNFDVEMNSEEAKDYITEYYHNYRGLKAWHEHLSHSTVVHTPLGRPRNTKNFTEKLNYPVQGGAAEVLLICLGKLHPRLQQLNARCVNTVHDEIVLEAPTSSASETAEFLKSMMEESWQDYLKLLNLKYEFEVGKVYVGKDWSISI